MRQARAVVLSVVALVAALVAAGRAAGRPPFVPGEHPPIVESFLRSGEPDAVSAEAIRDMQVATLGGRLRASLTARTTLADGRFTFEVLRSDGSDLLRTRVLVAALDAERVSHQPGESAKAALSPGNYAFAVEGSGGAGLVRLRLTPRRRSRMLVDGTLLVEGPHGDLVQLAGRLSETPSWWTTRVDVLRRYERIGGVRVPVEMSSRAAVRVAGSATFSMVYRYLTINGRAVGDER